MRISTLQNSPILDFQLLLLSAAADASAVPTPELVLDTQRADPLNGSDATVK